MGHYYLSCGDERPFAQVIHLHSFPSLKKSPSTMPAAPPNVESIRKAVEGSKRSAEASIGLSLRGIELVENDEKYELDESEFEIPPGVDTPFTFGASSDTLVPAGSFASLTLTQATIKLIFR